MSTGREGATPTQSCCLSNLFLLASKSCVSLSASALVPFVPFCRSGGHQLHCLSVSRITDRSHDEYVAYSERNAGLSPVYC